VVAAVGLADIWPLHVRFTNYIRLLED